MKCDKCGAYIGKRDEVCGRCGTMPRAFRGKGESQYDGLGCGLSAICLLIPSVGFGCAIYFFWQKDYPKAIMALILASVDILLSLIIMFFKSPYFMPTI